jgi:RNA polymerase sigma-70 factor (ECF subfamily)
VNTYENWGRVVRHDNGGITAVEITDSAGVHALLALMCFHAARFDARIAQSGTIVLLEEQDRSAWNWNDVREGMAWLARSAAGAELTRYHVEAGIAWERCRAPSFTDTDWPYLRPAFPPVIPLGTW